MLELHYNISCEIALGVLLSVFIARGLPIVHYSRKFGAGLGGSVFAVSLTGCES